MRSELKIPTGLAMILGFIFSVVVANILELPNVWFTVLFILGLTLASTYLIAIGMGFKDFDYRERVEDADSFKWTVLIDNVSVGVLSDAELAKLQRAAFQEVRTGVAQILNAFFVIITVAARLVVIIPALSALFFGVNPLFDPAGVAESLSTIQAMIAEMMEESPIRLLAGFVGAVLIFVAFMYLLGPTCGYKNHYQNHVHRELRHRFGAPRGSQVVLTIATLGTAMMNPDSHHKLPKSK